MDWINFKEQKPPYGVAVLVCLNRGLITIAYTSHKDGLPTWELFGPIDDILGLNENDSVDYWMKLPAAPIIK